MLKKIKKDLSAVPSSNKVMVFISNRGFHALLIYRISHFLWKKKIPMLPLLLTRIVQIVYSIDINYRADIGGGCAIFHGFGLVIGNDVVIGENSKLYHGVTLGRLHPDSGKPDGQPKIGNNVMIGAGAKVLGNIIVGENSKVGANSVVIENVPNNATAFGIPAKFKVKK